MRDLNTEGSETVDSNNKHKQAAETLLLFHFIALSSNKRMSAGSYTFPFLENYRNLDFYSLLPLSKHLIFFYMTSPTPPSHSFRHQLKVQESDIDEMGHVNNVIYLRWVQEVAQAHWESAPRHLRDQYAWVVLRHEIDYRHPALREDAVIGYTWIGTHSGAKVERFVSLYKASTHKLLAESKTTWCLLDAGNHRPRRIDDELVQAFS